MKKMEIEIWSDVQCPFCYIGKHKFEQALDQFAHREDLNITWKSFQLNPKLSTDPNISTLQYLAKHKGMSVEQTQQMTQHVSNSAKSIGLAFNFDQAVVANTHKAHQLLHLAKTKNLQNELKERLLEAQFVTGKNVDDQGTLLEVGESVGLAKELIHQTLSTNQYANEVAADIHESQELGISGVPFFVFDRKYGISGAQEPKAFLETIQKSYTDWKANQPNIKLETTTGQTCSTQQDAKGC